MLLLQLQSQPVVNVSAEKQRILIGELFTLKLDLKGMPAGGAVKWLLPDSLQHFEYLSADSSNPLQLLLTLTSFDSGFHRVEGIRVQLPATYNAKAQTMYVNTEPIRVLWDTSGNNLMRDIRDLEEIPYKGLSSMGYLLALLLLLSVVVLYNILRRKKTVPQAIVSETNLHPLDEFLQLTKFIAQEGWSGMELKRKHFLRLSFACKRYFERRTRLRLQHLTTGELLLQLRQYFSNAELSEAAAALRLGDAVKFAGYDANEAECSKAMEALRTFMETAEEKLSKTSA